MRWACLRVAALGVMAAGMMPAEGCHAPHRLGFPNQYMFLGQDAVAVPGEEVPLLARLRKGSSFSDVEEVTVNFYRDGVLYDSEMVDGEGEVRSSVIVRRPGDYLVTAECSPPGGKPPIPLHAPFHIACREPNTPLLVVDIDKTLACPPFRAAFEGDPNPLPRSAEVLSSLAKDYTVVYLTDRSDYLRIRTEDWLHRHGYPAGPIIMARLDDLTTGGGHGIRKIATVFGVIGMMLDPKGENGKAEFKSKQMAELRERFTGKIVGIGDRTSDAQAYAAAGAEAFLLLWIDQPASADSLEHQARDLGDLPASAEVVRDWDEFADALRRGTRHPPAEAQARLRKMAADLSAKR